MRGWQAKWLNLEWARCYGLAPQFKRWLRRPSESGLAALPRYSGNTRSTPNANGRLAMPSRVDRVTRPAT